MSHPILDAFLDPDAGGALAGLIVDFTLAQPTQTYLDAERLLANLDRVLDERLSERNIAAHIRPAIDREIARAKERGDTVGDWITAEAQAELRSLAARPITLNQRTVEKAVKQEQVRTMIRTVIRDTLDRFIKTVKTGGDTAAGSVGRRAFGFANRASRGVLGAVGGQIEARLAAAVNTFVAHSMDGVLDKTVAVICAPESATQASRMALQMFDHIMKMESAEVAGHAEKVPWDDLMEPVPGMIAHNLNRAPIREGITAEVNAFLAIEGKKPISALWVDDEALEAFRAEMIGQLTPLIAAFGATEAFGHWIAAHG